LNGLTEEGSFGPADSHHLLATALGRKNPEAAMRQGGWKDMRSLAGYMMTDAEYRCELIERRGLTGTKVSRRKRSDGRK
jgi:hypothetical protein